MAILRRPEYRKARLRRRQHARRWPLGRLLVKLYADIRESVMPIFTPLLNCLQRGVRDDDYIVKANKSWGGDGHFWDLAVSGAATTRNTSREEVSVHYEATGMAPSRPRFWRNPFVR